MNNEVSYYLMMCEIMKGSYDMSAIDKLKKLKLIHWLCFVFCFVLEENKRTVGLDDF